MSSLYSILALFSNSGKNENKPTPLKQQVMTDFRYTSDFVDMLSTHGPVVEKPDLFYSKIYATRDYYVLCAKLGVVAILVTNFSI